VSVRLVAVLGYSARRSDGLHALCAARLRHAEQLAASGDTVLLSGWARRRNGAGEAELMRTAWNGADVRLISDGTARNTRENATRSWPARSSASPRSRFTWYASAPAAQGCLAWQSQDLTPAASV